MSIFTHVRLKKTPHNFSLNVFSLIFLFIADIFILSILFFGLSQQIEQLTDENEYFPGQYRAMYIEKNWVENDIMQQIGMFVLRKMRTIEDEKTYKHMHPVCQKTRNIFSAISGNTQAVELLKKRERLHKEYNNYDAYQKNTNPQAQDLLTAIGQVDEELKKMPAIQAAIQYIFKQQKIDFVHDIRMHKRFFAVKRTIFGFVFLFPVLIVLFLWNRRAGRKGKNLGIIVSSHLMIVSLIPILFELIRLIMEVIPKFLLKTIYDTLMVLNLISFWYYGVVVLCVLLISGVIWFLQTKVFSHERCIMKSMQKGTCFRCGCKISYQHDYCPNCAYRVLAPCETCGSKTPNDLTYCQHCGNKRSKME